MYSRLMSVTTTRLALLTGAQLPQVGFGVWEVPEGATTRNSVTAALELGYRHIDTARILRQRGRCRRGDQGELGSRDQVFVTTKLWNDDHGYDAALRALDASLGRLGMDYVDLYLIHWPVPGKRRDSWRALERAFADGRARAIGRQQLHGAAPARDARRGQGGSSRQPDRALAVPPAPRYLRAVPRARHRGRGVLSADPGEAAR